MKIDQIILEHERNLNIILGELVKAGAQLTGSRYFAPHEANASDWDFFMDTAMWDKVPQSIKTCFNRSYPQKKYGDSQLVRLMQCSSYAVDVQIVKDFALKKKIQEIIAKNGFLPDNKDERKHYWNLAYSAFESAVAPWLWL